MCENTSFVDLALNNRDNTLLSYLEDKFSRTHIVENDSFEEPRQICSKSSTESDISSDLRIKSGSISSSDTITPVLLVNQEILQNLEYANSKAEKLYVLNAILHSQIDAFYYGDLFRIFREYLHESDTEIFEFTLEIHEKCINSSWELSKDAFVNLLETLYLYYCSLECDIYVNKYPYRNAFKIYKLVLNTFNRMFLHVPRYGHRRLEKIIGNFVDLLFVDVPSNDCSTLTPINMIACLDTDANWCKVLVHGSCTRDLLFKCIGRNLNLAKYFYVVVSDWMNESCVPKAKRQDIITPVIVRYATFVHSVFMCNALSKFKSFNDLFPTTINENKTVISLDSFTAMFVSFLKAKSKILPDSVNHCVVECVVNFLQLHSAESILQNMQNILEYANSKNGRKYMLEIIKQLFDDECTTRSLINSIIHTKRSRAGLTSEGRLLRSRPNSVVSSRHNVFAVLMNVVISMLRSSNNQNNFKRIFGIMSSVLQCHEFYLMYGNDYSTLVEFVELLSLKYENKTDDIEADDSNELMSSLNELLFAIGSTPIGFQLLIKRTNDVLMRICLLKLEKTITPWYFKPWKNAVSFMVFTEYDLDLNFYYKKVNSEALQLIEEITNCEYSDDHHLNDIVEKIIICVDSLSYCPNGIRGLLNSEFDYSTPFSDVYRVRNFKDLIEKYALELNYEYQLQCLALQCLQKMTRSISSRIYLLCSLNYEKNLLNVHSNYTSSSGEIIVDECSTLRTELLNGKFSLRDLPPVRDRFSARTRSARKSSARMTLSRKKLSDIQKFLQETKHGLYDSNWLRQARRAFRASLTCNIKMSVLVELIEKSAKSIAKPAKIRKLFVTDETAALKLHHEDYKGIELAIRFGVKNHILQQNPSNEENLAQILKVIRDYNSYQISETFVKFDCTLATLFIMCCGSVDKCLQIISYIVPLPVTMFIWPQITPNFTQKRYVFGHLLEWLLYQEVPNVFSVLSIYGISWWLICKCHLDDCFWNSMEWIDICRWLCITILYPADNLIYFFTSVAFKNESKIVQSSNENELRNILHVIFNTYQLEEHNMLYIDYLSKKYHFFISSHFIG